MIKGFAHVVNNLPLIMLSTDVWTSILTLADNVMLRKHKKKEVSDSIKVVRSNESILESRIHPKYISIHFVTLLRLSCMQADQKLTFL